LRLYHSGPGDVVSRCIRNEDQSNTKNDGYNGHDSQWKLIRKSAKVGLRIIIDKNTHQGTPGRLENDHSHNWTSKISRRYFSHIRPRIRRIESIWHAEKQSSNVECCSGMTANLNREWYNRQSWRNPKTETSTHHGTKAEDEDARYQSSEVH